MKLILKDLLLISLMLLTFMVVLRVTWSLTPFWIKRIVKVSFIIFKNVYKLISLSFSGLKFVFKQIIIAFRHIGLLYKKRMVIPSQEQPSIAE